MAKSPSVNKTASKKVKAKPKAKFPTDQQKEQTQVTQKNTFEAKFGEGTAFDLDYGKLVIIALLLYVAYQVS